jgi:hypothetical protein
MDLEQINLLPAEMKDRYAKLERTFDSPGWALIMEWAASQHAAHQAAELNSKSWEDTLLNRGARTAYGVMQMLQKYSEQEFEAAAATVQEQKRRIDEEEFE